MSDTEPVTLEDMIAQFKALPISGHAHAIGHLCIAWSQLENLTDVFLSVALQIKPTHIRTAVINNIPTRDKWKMLLAVCFLKQFKAGWYDQLSAEISRIDNELRPERNRMVHDQWDFSTSEILRRQHVAKVYKIQSRELAFKDTETKPVSERDIWELTTSIMASTGELLVLLEDYVGHDLSTSPKTSE